MYIYFSNWIHFYINSNIFISSDIFWSRNSFTIKPTRTSIMYQHAGVGNIIGMEISNFEVIGGLRRGKLFAGNALYFTERAVGEKDLVAAL